MVMAQLRVATVAVQESPAGSLTVTLPVGVPLPGETGTTVNVTVTACPATDGLGDCEVMVVFVLALFTVCATPGEVLELKFVSPE
jgi:hypothetical protein